MPTATKTTKSPFADSVHSGPPAHEVEAKDKRIRDKREASGFPVIEFGRDGEDKRIFDRTEGMGGHLDPLLNPNPLAELIDPYQAANPHLSFKLLGSVATKIKGLRGYEPVIDSRGEKVMLGGMMLGSIPKTVTDHRHKHYQTESTEAVSSIEESYAEDVRRIKRDAQSAGLHVLEPGDMPAGEFTDFETGETKFLG
jgi:hypothetical protein